MRRSNGLMPINWLREMSSQTSKKKSRESVILSSPNCTNKLVELLVVECQVECLAECQVECLEACLEVCQEVEQEVQVLEVLEDPPLKKLTKKETKPIFDPYISQAQSHFQPYLHIISIE